MTTRPRTTLRASCAAATVLAALLAAGPVAAADFFSTLGFETEGLNLETEAVEERELHGTFRDAVDFHLTFNADRANPIVLMQNQQSQVLIAFLDGEPFELVDSSILDGLVLGEDLVDVPFDADDTVVLLTSEGNHYKIGNPADNGDGTVTVQCAAL